jgi:hypothetical protein
MKKYMHHIAVCLLFILGLSSCQGLFDLDSDQVLFTEENQLNAPTDTVYSVIGILSKMQIIADRTVLLGEIRGDLVSLTNDANLQLQALANFTSDTKNSYNAPEDYYAIINNCNYFLANADTLLKKRNYSVFQKEYAAVKGFRAWTYLQLAQIYGSVPFITEPILTEKQANATYAKKDIKALAAFFIDDLKSSINIPFPSYGSISGTNSQSFYIPIRLLLGDWCLWAERYAEAAQYYHDYLALPNSYKQIGTNRASWSSASANFENWSSSYGTMFSLTGTEVISYIPMQTNKFYGLVSNLRNVYNSTQDNRYFYQATFSNALKELSRSQSNCKIYINPITTLRDTLIAPSENPVSDLLVGDLRLASVFTHSTVSNTSLSTYSTSYQTISKILTQPVTYRRGLVYLRYAEAMNRAGFPTAAFAVLKYGMTETNIRKYVDSTEIRASGTLLSWPRTAFTDLNTIGIHARGCGESDANKRFKIPAQPTKADTIQTVEDMICDELALETPFEGNRFYDLIRMALRRQDPETFLGNKLAVRKGANQFDQNLFDKMKSRSNWYLPLK